VADHLAAAHTAYEVASGLLRVLHDHDWLGRVTSVNYERKLARDILGAWPADGGLYGTETVADWVGERHRRTRRCLRLMAARGVVRELRLRGGTRGEGHQGGLWQLVSAAVPQDRYVVVGSRS
jgi:hypothetical protein